ncbi:LppX_LprAFG lipoprotein [Aeromicrobium sp. NPDC092404]|uniref:LppX_LprAFG lipoprotein n=1 Tax=Aeromicrobium sp. NPDC092404 TaxID=3154976 RepID=UPI003444862D
MTISRKLSSIASLVLVAGLTLSACGGKDDSGDKNESTNTGGGGKTSLTQANFSQVLAQSQAKAKSAHVTMTIGVGGQEIEAEGDVAVGETAADSALSMTMDMGGTQLDMRLVDEIMYMNMGAMTEDKYLKIDLNDKSNPFAKQYGQIMDQMDPAKQMDQFKDAVTSFEKKGEPQKIDGVDAQPYVVKVDTTKIKAFKDLPAASRSQVPETIVYTMYVGSDDLLRRMEFELAGSKSTMNYSKWGEPVDVEAPPADEISDKDISQLGQVPTPQA